MTVCVLGDINVDLELLLPTTGAGEHANPDPTLSGGGSAANTAAALARLAIPTRFCGVVGSDAFGAAAITSLESAGVDVARVRRFPGASTVAVLVVVPPDGERIIYVWPPRGGAQLDLRVDEALGAIAGAEWIHVSGIALRGEPAAGSIIAAMREARTGGATVSLDVNLRLENWGWEDGFRDTIEAAMNAADVVFGGASDELAPLAGTDDPVGAIGYLARPDRVVVGRLGSAGAMADAGAGPVASPGWQLPVVDTVGAGDAFDAGFIAARLRGEGLQECLDYANAVAALTIGGHGARSTPSHGQVTSMIGSGSVQRT